jgi:hypothetical protein
MARTLRFLEDDEVLHIAKGGLASISEPTAGQLIARGVAEPATEDDEDCCRLTKVSTR